MTKLSSLATDKPTYYLPHHAVLRKSSATTKLRVVFDASAKTSTGKSLNDIQAVGPTIQNDLFTILLRFRKHAFVITADVEKMYRQIWLREDQRPLHRILWRFDSSATIDCYELNTITYGTASAPYLATRCLIEIGLNARSTFPNASRTIINDFYVDDLLTGADDLDYLLEIQREVRQLLSFRGLQLRKWASNSPRLIQAIECDGKREENFTIGEKENYKALGLSWNVASDMFFFKVETPNKTSRTTKRSILSCIAQIFDPLGLISPVTTSAKIILQKLWQLKLSWDESVPLDILAKWTLFKDSLDNLNDLRIPRHASCPNPIEIQLHAFCDASEAAYGACLYVRAKDKLSNCTVRLLCSKGRVAPLKQCSIPRLELCGALILSQLVAKIRDIYEIPSNNCYNWSDSTIALAWISDRSSRWKVFVANRVAEIQENTKGSHWMHVSGKENPADLVSRGVEPLNLMNNPLWWNGPEWLVYPSHEWPSHDISFQNTFFNVPEQRTIGAVATVSQHCTLIDKFSTLETLRRVTAWCKRFAENSRVKMEDRNFGPITLKELNAALITLIKKIQMECFEKEFTDLQNGKAISSSSKLLCLNPFLHDGILRVGGRLNNTLYDYNKQHPMVLPKHRLTKLIISHEHERLLHAGPQTVLASLRNRYWPIAGKSQTKLVTRTCIKCFRSNPRHVIPIMGDLPSARATPSRAFLECGVDYAGPINLKDRKTRGAKTIKSYICLFVCLATKAIHLELVGDLTTESFIAALRRFASRRGTPANLYSDNGGNFIGANRELSELRNFLKDSNAQLSKDASRCDINWHFIPPRAPHFGGIWEAGVKSVKTHIKRVLSDAMLTYEDFLTTLVQIEGCLNSRPLHSLSDDVNDLTPLTQHTFSLESH